MAPNRRAPSLGLWRIRGAFQIVGVGVELIGDVVQFGGDIGSALGDAPQFDRGHPQEPDRVVYGPKQRVFHVNCPSRGCAIL